MIIRAYPSVVRRRRPITHKNHFLLTLFSKNFKFLSHIGYATALTCYFGLKICVIHINKLIKSQVLCLPALGGFEFIKRWSIIGLVLQTFKVRRHVFMGNVLYLKWLLNKRKGWKRIGLFCFYTQSINNNTLPWRFVSHRFWKISSLGRWSDLPSTSFNIFNNKWE